MTQMTQMPDASVRRPYGHGKRTLYGVLWAGWTAVLTIGGFAMLFGGQATGLIGIALGLLAGWYDFKIWTWRARRLIFFIIW